MLTFNIVLLPRQWPSAYNCSDSSTSGAFQLVVVLPSLLQSSSPADICLPTRRPFSCNSILFAICTDTFSKLCKQRIKWHVEEWSVALLCSYYVQSLLWLLSRSFRRCLRNRLLSGSAMRFTVRSFGCTMRRAPYRELQRRITSLTVGTWRSLRITVFGTYKGASTIMGKVFDWKSFRARRIGCKKVQLMKGIKTRLSSQAEDFFAHAYKNALLYMF
jgi:hypothetical protein